MTEWSSNTLDAKFSPNDELPNFKDTDVVPAATTDRSGQPGAIFIVLFAETICFGENTKILTDLGYIPIRDLRRGDRVKTVKHGFVPISIIGYSNVRNPGDESRTISRLYVYPRSAHPDLNDDLILTGNHSVLVSSFRDEKERERTIEVLKNIYVTDDFYRLPAYADSRSLPYTKGGMYKMYNFSLEHADKYMNYGVYANGLLVECSFTAHLEGASAP